MIFTNKTYGCSTFKVVEKTTSMMINKGKKLAESETKADEEHKKYKNGVEESVLHGDD